MYHDVIITQDQQKNNTIPVQLSKILSEKSIIRILQSATKPKNAYELSRDCDISLTTVYRQVKRLNDKKLITVSGSIDAGGKKHFTFKSKSNVYCKCACSNIDLTEFLKQKE